MLTDFLEVDGTDVPFADYVDGITHTHRRRVTVRVLDLEHKRLRWIDDVLDGQVTIDVESRGASRVANIRLLDPSRSIGWEPDSPASAPLHLRRMIQIWDERLIPGYGWVRCPVFCGPVVEMDRDGAEVSVLAHSKERLALGDFGRAYEWKKKRLVTGVIREILELAGEASSRIHLPTMPNARLQDDLNVSRTDKPWIQARKLARSVGCELFYDARGHVQMRRQPTRPTLTIDADWLLGPARVDRPEIEFYNGWVVLGKNPKGDTPRVSSGLIGLPKTNEFSAYNPGLMRNGKPYWRIREEERPHVSTDAKALEIARNLRDERIRFAADVSLDCLPFPFVEEWDLFLVRDAQVGPMWVRVKEATIPLVSGGMTIGAIKRASTFRRRGGGFHPASHGGL